MKIIYQICLAGLLLILLFVVKDDLRSAYGKFLTYLDSKGSISKVIPNAGDINNENTTKVVSTPGALRVIDTIVNKSVATLTKEGVISETNLNRKENGNLPALIENAKLDTSAGMKLKDLFAKQYFEHVSPSGVTVTNLVTQSGYDYILIGENLALGNFKGDKGVLDAWMASPGHRANILNAKYTEIGVAVGQGIYQGENVWIAVQHFGLPKSACPAVSDVLLGTINLNEKQITTMSDNLSTLRKEISNGGVYNGMSSNELLNQYNSLVNTYNNFIRDTKQKIDNYNLQVNNFNSCITNNT